MSSFALPDALRMKTHLIVAQKSYVANLMEDIDLSIAITEGPQVNAYFAATADMEPFQQGNWVGEVRQGGSVNYRIVRFSPHGNGTHTECVGHITPEIHSINRCFTQFHCAAQLVSITPSLRENGDRLIEAHQLKPLLHGGIDAVIVRTLPNPKTKQRLNHSGANSPYFSAQAVQLLVEMGCKHILTDLPSLDREQDEGKLAAHHIFWNYPTAPRMDCTITELIYVPNNALDGLYLLNLQVAAFENDAAPSRPVIFALREA